MYLTCSVQVIHQYSDTVRSFNNDNCERQHIVNSVQTMYYSPSNTYPFSYTILFWTKQDSGTIVFLVFLSLVMSLILTCILMVIISRIDFTKISNRYHCFNLKGYIRSIYPSRFSKMNDDLQNHPI